MRRLPHLQALLSMSPRYRPEPHTGGSGCPPIRTRSASVKARSRFSDPRRRVDANRFGVLYLGSSLKVCFIEAILRDDRYHVVGRLPIAEKLLENRAVASIAPTRDLKLLDLRGDGSVRMGIPSDVARGSKQTLARAWSVAFHEHFEAVDGILYPSRLNGEHNLAIYERAVPALASTAQASLLRARLRGGHRHIEGRTCVIRAVSNGSRAAPRNVRQLGRSTTQEKMTTACH